jgi:antimicrobial peptide system SdpB family protein
MLAIQQIVMRWASSSPWSNVYGVARSLLAMGTALTLIFNNSNILFRPLTESADRIAGIGMSKFSIFYLLSNHLELARLISIIILLIVASGWRPRITEFFHWWMSFSLMSSCSIIDGGDQITAILALFLLPVCVSDKRKWHWSRANNLTNSDNLSKFKSIISMSCFLVIRIQVAIIYLNAGVEKLSVREWTDGTALYYWFENPVIGLDNFMKPLVMPLLSNPFIVAFSTWGVIATEIVLFMALTMPKKYWPMLLKIGFALHFGIIVVHGLVSFFFAMAAALVLYLRPLEQEFIFRPFSFYSLKSIRNSKPTIYDSL